MCMDREPMNHFPSGFPIPSFFRFLVVTLQPHADGRQSLHDG